MMSFKTENTSGKVDSVRDNLELLDIGMETSVTAETSAAVQSSALAESSRRRSANSDCQVPCPGDSETVQTVSTRRRHSVSVSAHVKDNVITVSDDVVKFSLTGGKPAFDTKVDTAKNCTELSYAVESESVARNGVESSSDRNSFEPADVVDLRSPPDVTYAGRTGKVSVDSKSNDEQCIGGPRGGDNSDVHSNLIHDVSVSLVGTPRACCEACASNTTGRVEVQDEFSRVLFTAEMERSEDTDKPSGLNMWYAKHKTDGRYMKPMRHMSTLDRKSRPVPLPRSNTFRAKGVNEASLPVSNRSSIPVQYETLSSLQSKICQTVGPGDGTESEYLIPVNFSEIYVDHRTVEEWPGQKSGEGAAEIPSYHESDYDVLREDVWASPDDHSKVVTREPEVLLGSGLQSYESDYDVVRDDIWADDSDTYDGLVGCEDEDMQDGSGTGPGADNADRRNSHPMDVSVE